VAGRTLALLGALGLAACAPPSAMPPPLPLAADEHGTAGLAVGGGYGVSAGAVVTGGFVLDADLQWWGL
jgi:hypothetical protein